MKPLALAVFFVALGFSQSNDCDTLDKCEDALHNDRHNSLAYFRIAEVYFSLGSYQNSANLYREALNGRLQPRWVEVWAHVNLGKIFDVTNQRDRALNEYRQALRTKDNTRGALDEATKYIESPYKLNQEASPPK